MIDIEDSWEWRATEESPCSVAVIGIGFCLLFDQMLKILSRYFLRVHAVCRTYFPVDDAHVRGDAMFVPPWVGIL
jgi:hypothetical protein